jgi:pimeloyl-ACP methyl ester carboxylesterase
MSTYILIPGSWHGAWCWHKVIPLLQKQGHRVITPDLPGHGKDYRDPATVTLKDYTDCVGGILNQLSEPAILVGHSRGGIVLSQTAEYFPQKINTLVYLCAFLIPNRQPMVATALSDKNSLIGPNLIFNEEKGWHMLKEEAFKDALYGDCSEEDLALAKSLLTPEPNAPIGTPLQLTDENFGRVPKVYIECLNDRGISPAVQKQMYTATPCQQVLSLNSSHSPFLSMPGALAEKLLTAQGIGMKG